VASITIHNINDDQKHRLCLRAAKHGRSIEAEVRDILYQAMAQPAPPTNLAASIRARVATLGGVTLELPLREAMREPPNFD